MAKLAIRVTVFLFFLVFSNARISLDQPGDGVTVLDPLASLPESNLESTASTSILLPSEKSEPETELDTETAATESLEEIKNPHVYSVPLTAASFNPASRQFSRRPFPPFRHRRPCLHHHRQLQPLGSQVRGHGLSYDDDMILSMEEDMRFDPALHDMAREFPARWVKYHRGGFRFPRTKHEERGHHHRHVEGGEKKKEEPEGGFMKKFRKFLDPRF